MKRKYIHRLQVLNPLTNSDIIGNVQYFMVKTRGLGSSESDIEKCTSPTVAAIDNTEPHDWTLSHHQVVPENAEDGAKLPDNLLKELKLEAKKLQINADQIIPLKKAKSRSLNITIMIPDLDSLQTELKAKVTPGTVTQFSMPIPETELENVAHKLYDSRSRILCFRNATSASVVPTSFLEWSKMIDQDWKERKPPKGPTPLSNYPSEAVMDAILFATDDDFLSRRDVRQIFADNALSPEDAVLFEMKEITEESGTRTLENIPETSRCSVM
jgi:hypothetical protein